MTTLSPPNTDDFAAYFKYLTAMNPPVMRLWAATDETGFWSAALEAIVHAIRKLEAGARHYRALPEPGLSLLLTQILESGGVPAVSEGYHNGHVDVTIEHPTSRFNSLLGECKIYDGPAHHCQGCDQLVNRYSSGRSNYGFCLEFFLDPDMYGKLQKLRESCDAKRAECQKAETQPHAIKGAFMTASAHSSGTIIIVLHLGCNLYIPN